MPCAFRLKPIDLTLLNNTKSYVFLTLFTVHPVPCTLHSFNLLYALSSSLYAYLIHTFLTCKRSVMPTRVFRMPSCISVVMPSFIACSLISSILARP